MPQKVPIPPQANPGNLRSLTSCSADASPDQAEIYSIVHDLYSPATRLEAIAILMNLVERGLLIRTYLG